MKWILLPVALLVLGLTPACEGTQGIAGLPGADGENGLNGLNGEDGEDGAGCTVAANADGSRTITCADGTTATVSNGQPGQPGQNGQDGQDGEDGQAGTSCSVAGNEDGTKTITCTDGTEVVVRDGEPGQNGQDGNPGQDGEDGQNGLGYVPLDPTGLVGLVRDTAGDPVIGATVYLVPNTAIPSEAIALGDIVAARVSTVDEPLEDTIVARGGEFLRALTDANGIYRLAGIPAGGYFLTVIPAADDAEHLPGGSHCRHAMDQAALLGQQLDIEVSTRPSPTAEYVGASVCLTCHGVVHEGRTLHMNGIRVVGQTGPLQDGRRFPEWNRPLAEKFTAAGTTLYFHAYNGNASSPSWRVSETDPGSGVSFTARLHSTGTRYFVDLTNVAGPGSTTYEVELTYGGGLYKQRYVTVIDGSRYVLPIQYNYEGSVSEAGVPASRWVWQHYNAQNWYDEANHALKVPARGKAFDNNCAGCHFTGFSVSGDATAGWRAHGVPDRNGEYDYDGDGQVEQMNVSCESCHGPGSDHWYVAGQGRAIVSPNLLTPEREVTVCAQCHTRGLGVGGGATEAPLDASGRMAWAGTSRAEFLTGFVSRMDDGLWSTAAGDGVHSVKHHQQVSDFIRSGKYRNPTMLMTCSDCHDPHGQSTRDAQIRDDIDSAQGGPGLCLSCHDSSIPAGPTTAARIQAHYAEQGIANVSMGDIACIDCHMPKTAKSGSGTAQATIQGVTYYHGDISSHMFDVPLRASFPGRGNEMMAIPYTNACGVCHSAAP